MEARTAAILLRVSKQDGSQDTENQLHDCMTLAIRRGYGVPPDYVIREEVSGTKLRGERPGLDQAAELAHKGKIAALIVWKLDRFSRDDTLLGGLVMLGEFDEAYNVPVISYSEAYLETTGPMRRPLRALALSLAAEYRKSVVDNTNRALQKKNREKEKHGSFLVTGQHSKRRGQRITRLGRPDALSDDQKKQVEQWWRDTEPREANAWRGGNPSAYMLAKMLGLPETSVRRLVRRLEKMQGTAK
jgi:DNA invertase Pin-like site-specific DNA recombinase